MALAKFQQLMQSAILAGDPVPRNILGDRLTPAARLQVYRNNTFITLSEALKANFPVVFKLVGEDFFTAMAKIYLAKDPPSDGALLRLGGSFPAFLETFEPAGQLPYLPDVARLELAWLDAYHGPDVPPLAIDRLAAVPADIVGGCCFELHPTATLLRSAYPIDRIWAVNQEDGSDALVDLAEGPLALLVLRPETDVQLMRLTAGEAMFLQGLQGGLSLAEAVDAVNDAAFELGSSLARLFVGGTFSLLQEPNKEDPE